MPGELAALIEQRKYGEIKRKFNEMNVVDIAALLEDGLPSAEVVRLFRLLKKDEAAEVFSYLESETQQLIVEGISDRELAYILDDLFLDDAVDFVEEMPAGVVKRVLGNVSEETRRQINAFLQYPEDSAGSIMTIELVDLKADSTVQGAFAHIRKTGVDKETIYTCYVIDDFRKLVGAVSVKALLLADETARVGDIMEKGVIFAHTTDDQESVASRCRKYGLLAMPVVDSEERLVGIVTIDDIVDIIEEENTEDFEKMAALVPSEDPYLKTGVLRMTKNRIVWLLLLMLSATITGGLISSFEEGLALMPALMAFIPMLMDTGGNAGSQSSTLVIRGMALEEIALRDVFKVLWKEMRVAALCGVALAVVNFGRILLMQRDAMLALTVSLSLLVTVLLSKIIGALLPLGAKAVKLDPAVMASPIITTIVDACSLIFYFAFARMLLHI